MSVTPQELCQSLPPIVAKPFERIAALRTRCAEPHGAPLGRHASRQPFLGPLAATPLLRALPTRPASLVLHVQPLLSSRAVCCELLLARAFSSPTIVVLRPFVTGATALR